jgi:hypothetical protein
MKKATVLAFIVIFVACMFHFFYAEDHCPVHCPSRGGQFGHVHHHHPAACVCLCFWSSLMGPEASDFAATSVFLSLLVRPADGRPVGMLAADITPPPRSSLV